MLAETDVSALCIDVSRVKSLAGEPRKSVSLAALVLLITICLMSFELFVQKRSRLFLGYLLIEKMGFLFFHYR